MKYTSIQTILALKTDPNYHHIGLFNYTGQPVINFNSRKDKYKEKVQQIVERLKHQHLEDGIYTVKVKANAKKDTMPDIFTVKKGKVTKKQETLSESPPVTTPLIEQEDLIKLKVDHEILINEKSIWSSTNKKLLEECQLKDERIEELEGHCEQWEKELEEMSEGSQIQTSGFGNIIEQGLPILDKFLDNQTKNREQKLKEYDLNKAMWDAQQGKPPVYHANFGQPPKSGAMGENTQPPDPREQQQFNEALYFYERFTILAELDKEMAAQWAAILASIDVETRTMKSPE